MNGFQIGVRSGSPIERAGQRITLKTFVFQLATPGGGVIYHRPIAVTVQAEGQPAHTLPVFNINRLAQVAIVGLSLITLGIVRRRLHHD